MRMRLAPPTVPSNHPAVKAPLWTGSEHARANPEQVACEEGTVSCGPLPCPWCAVAPCRRGCVKTSYFSALPHGTTAGKQIR